MTEHAREMGRTDGFRKRELGLLDVLRDLDEATLDLDDIDELRDLVLALLRAGTTGLCMLESQTLMAIGARALCHA